MYLVQPEAFLQMCSAGDPVAAAWLSRQRQTVQGGAAYSTHIAAGGEQGGARVPGGRARRRRAQLPERQAEHRPSPPERSGHCAAGVRMAPVRLHGMQKAVTTMTRTRTSLRWKTAPPSMTRARTTCALTSPWPLASPQTAPVYYHGGLHAASPLLHGSSAIHASGGARHTSLNSPALA